MKKIIGLCLVLTVLCSVFTGCKHETKLTSNNIKKYLNIRTEYTRIEGEDWYLEGIKIDGDDHYLQYKVDPKRHGYFENVSFDAETYMGDGMVYVWRVDFDDPIYNKDREGEVKETIELPVDGKYRGKKHEVHKVGYHIKDTRLDDQSISVTNVKGKFVTE